MSDLDRVLERLREKAFCGSWPDDSSMIYLADAERILTDAVAAKDKVLAIEKYSRAVANRIDDIEQARAAERARIREALLARDVTTASGVRVVLVEDITEVCGGSHD